MRQLFSATMLLLSTLCLSAQDSIPTTADSTKVSPWKYNGVTSLNFSQSSLTNWSAGGDNSIGANFLLNANLKYTKNNWLWNNALVIEYGITDTKTDGTKKATDRLALTTQLGYTTDNKWYYTLMADFETQIGKGYNYPNKDEYISKFMAPAYSNLSAGIEFRPKDSFYSIYFSPAAGKFTFVNDDYLSDKGFFGIDPGDHFKAEFGTFLKGTLQKEVMENVKIITDVNFFTAYNETFGNVDIDWNLLISMKINKFLNASINTSLKYDDDVKATNEDGTTKGSRVQFKEILGVGIGYNF